MNKLFFGDNHHILLEHIGLFVKLADPTKPMRTEVLAAGFYDLPVGKSYPKIQILTIRRTPPQNRTLRLSRPHRRQPYIQKSPARKEAERAGGDVLEHG